MNKKSGFTLIELLTVVVILGILTSIAVPQYRKSIQRTEAANALINLKTIFDSAKRAYASTSNWPNSFVGLDVDLLDVSAQGDMGEFRYAFDAADRTVSACRLAGGAAGGTFCLRAYYRRGGTRDVFTCNYADVKYRSLCDSLCRTPAGGVNVECVME